MWIEGTITPELLEMDSFLQVEGKQELVLFRNGKVLRNNRALAKLINGYKKKKKTRKITKHSMLLLSIQKKLAFKRSIIHLEDPAGVLI